MQSTFKIREEKLQQFQELVKAFDLRFVRNPFFFNGKATVCVDTVNLPAEKYNDFFETWRRMNTEIREIPKKTKFEKFKEKVKKWF